MANNEYINKVEYGGDTLIDLTSDTVTEDTLVEGYTAHTRSGASITGTLSDATQSAHGLMSTADKIKLDDVASITSKTYTDIFSGAFTVTTATDSGWESPHARASVASRIPKYNDYRVTVNGTEYIMPCGLWYERSNYNFKVYEYLGNLSLYTNVSYETSNIDFHTDLPFVIISDLNGESSIDVLTSTAGQYTIKIEKIVYTYTKIPNILKYDYTWAPFTMANNNGTYNGFSIGVNSLLNSQGTIALGYANQIEDSWGIAIGVGNKVTGDEGCAIGTNLNVAGEGAFAEGIGITLSNGEVDTRYGALGACSHVEGRGNTVTGSMSHVEGMWNDNSGIGSHVEGYHNNASSSFSHVEGTYNGSTGICEHVGGLNSVFPDYPNWTASTHYNVGDIVWRNDPYRGWIIIACINENTASEFSWDNWDSAKTSLETIGNGEYDWDNDQAGNSSNARRLDWDGNEYLKGDLYINCNADSSGGTNIGQLFANNNLYSTITNTAFVHFTSLTKDVPIKELVLDYDYTIDENDDFVGNDTTTFSNTGKNLLDTTKVAIQRAITILNGYGGITSGRIDNASLGSGASDYAIFSQVFPAGTYTFSCKYTDNINGIRILTTEPCTVGSTYNSYYNAYLKDESYPKESMTFTVEKPFQLGIVFKPKNDHITEQCAIYDIQLELGSKATSYEPFTGNVLKITWGQTIYKAQLDIINHQLKITHGYIASYAGETLPGAWISNQDEYAEGTSPSTGAEVIYELEQPTISTVPIDFDVAQAEGDNYIWHSSGNVKIVTYANNNKHALYSTERVKLSQDKVLDVRINNISIAKNGVVNLPIAATGNLGLVKPQGMGVGVNATNGEMYISKGSSVAIKAGSNDYAPIVASNQHEATFYGLAKAAGDTTQYLSTNAVGTYTSDAKTAIKSMLGVTEVPAVTSSDNGKVLRVVNGAWSAVQLPSASGVSF